MTITRPVSENITFTQQNGIKGHTAANQNRSNADSSDNVFHAGTASKGNNSSLQVQKTTIPSKTPPSCK